MNATARENDRAPFIVFEGGDGVGKSTQIRRLQDTLSENGFDVVVTREPGGSPGAETLRNLLVTGDVGAWTPISEALLMYAARAEHLAHTVNPARDSGKIVLCDRFADSTTAYQGAAGNVDPGLIESLYTYVVKDDGPTMTLILDLPVETALDRALDRTLDHTAARGGGAKDESRFEAKGQLFQQRVRAEFLRLAEAAPARRRVIDASGAADAISENVAGIVLPIVRKWRDAHG